MLVALTRERGANEGLRDLVGDRADVVEVPLTATDFRARDDVDAAVRAARHYGGFRALVVTSARCERYVNLVRPALEPVAEVFSVGPATSAMLQRAGWLVAGESRATALELEEMITDGPVLLLGAVDGRDELAAALRERGRDPHVVECYRTVAVTLDETQRTALTRADVVFIGAPSAWRAARALVDAAAWVLVPGVTTRDVVAAEHPRVLIGWGRDFDAAWDRVTSARG